MVCLRCTSFWRLWSDKFPKIIISSKALDVFDACCIFSNYYKSLRNICMKNQMIYLLWWQWWWLWWCWGRCKISRCHHWCQIGGAKYTIHKIKAARTFITFANNSSRLFEGKMKKSNNPYKVTTIMHHHRVCYSDYGHVTEYPFSKLQRWTYRNYLLPFSCQYLWLGYSWCF